MDPRDMPITSPSDIPIAEFAHAAAAGCVFELRCRLLADNARIGRDKVLACGLDELVKLIVAEARFAPILSEEDRTFLTGCAVLRNRLFHLELSRAKGKLETLGASLPRGRVHAVDIETREVTEVSKTSTLDGRVYGWLWESYATGAFAEASRVFHDAIEHLDRLQASLHE
jgi:hypothetical protein